ncbi:MAG: deoxyribodipyrimidine photolyase [Myxococcales bacterium]|nr:deoxyribodipyrimidine photolyase [Myxococcales bacterium]
MRPFPPLRVRAANDAPIRGDAEYVLYWMIGARRPTSSFALDRALAHARALGRPLVVFEALRAGYRWASDRHHRFILDGMASNQRAFAGAPVTYLPYVEPEPGAGSGLLAALASRAAVVVTDEAPGFFLPAMIEAAAPRLPVRLEVIDGCGLLPLRATDAVFPSAHALRRFLHRTLPAHLGEWPAADPLAGLELPRLRSPLPLGERWAPADPALLAGDPAALARLPIDHAVGPGALPGGATAGAEHLQRFVHERLPRDASARAHPDDDAQSGLSPYLHYGHVGAHQVVRLLLGRERWSADRLGKPSGSKAGWWGLSADTEAFLDELVTWRELGFNMASKRDDFDRYASLPGWAQATLAAHADDRREHLYGLDALAEARTHDPLWNAAQRQLVREGRIHNYLRMLWGKKILEWSATPADALAAMIELNNRFALDGRDPNSYSGIFWVLGRYDRPWGPDKPVIGLLRPMSSKNTARKLRVKGYVARYGPQAELLPGVAAR